jgi:5-methyltetrahydrofolate--homocysteine methyltransferase
MAQMEKIQNAMITGDNQGLTELVQTALDDGVDPGAILKDVLIPGMDIVGERMEQGAMFIPEVLMAAQAMGGAVERLKPLLGEGQANAAGKVVIGTVKGDLHDIGKNLVSMMMASSGFEMVDLGVDVEPDTFVEAIKEKECDIVALSALLTTTMGMIKRTVEAIDASGCRDKVKILIGGAPVTQAFSNEIGADGYAEDAGAAVRMAKALLQ